MKSVNSFSRVLLAFALLLGTCSVGLSQKIKIEKRDDLPRYTYQIDMKAVEFLNDQEAVLKLAEEVKADLLADLEKYDIQDNNTLQDFYADLGTIAMLEGDYDRYLELLAMRKELEEKEANRITMGLVGESWAKAKKVNEDDYMPIFRSELEKSVSGLPYEEVADNIKSTKASAEIVSENLIFGAVESAIQPILDGSNGEMSKDIATGLLGRANSLRFFIPVKDDVAAIFTAYLDANKVVKPDIWADREVVLKEGDGVAPVVLVVWDSGVDTDIFQPKGQMWTNKAEVPDNGKDDDNNGFVDDVHGIAYTLHSDKTPDLLFPIGDLEKDRARLQRLTKGLTDLESNIESEEAAELRGILSNLKQEEVKPFIEDIGKYGNYSHGTHVAGIAAKGNPYVRLLASRLTFDYHMIPEEPTIEQATKDAAAATEAVEYFKKYGARAVNMSWGGSLASVEAALEANNAGGTPEERKALAREIFEITNKSLFEAFKNAPDILFITSAGNADNDVRFDEFYPSSYDLPNILSVGAVDQAGDETSFTSLGKVDVYGNGFEVTSYVPGGDEIAYNGTSMSSPQVMNLVGKLLAKKPDLTVSQIRDLVINGADERNLGDRTIRLLNPKKSMELLSQM